MASTIPTIDSTGTASNFDLLLSSSVRIDNELANLSNAPVSASLFSISASDLSLDEIRTNVEALLATMNDTARTQIETLRTMSSDTNYRSGSAYLTEVAKRNRLIDKIRKFLAYLTQVWAQVLILMASLSQSTGTLISGSVDVDDIPVYLRKLKALNKRRFKREQQLQDLRTIYEKLKVAYQSQSQGVYYVPDMGRSLPEAPAQFTIPSTLGGQAGVTVDNSLVASLNEKQRQRLTQTIASLANQGVRVSRVNASSPTTIDLTNSTPVLQSALELTRTQLGSLMNQGVVVPTGPPMTENEATVLRLTSQKNLIEEELARRSQTPSEPAPNTEGGLASSEVVPGLPSDEQAPNPPTQEMEVDRLAEARQQEVDQEAAAARQEIIDEADRQPDEPVEQVVRNFEFDENSIGLPGAPQPQVRVPFAAPEPAIRSTDALLDQLATTPYTSDEVDQLLREPIERLVEAYNALSDTEQKRARAEQPQWVRLYTPYLRRLLNQTPPQILQVRDLLKNPSRPNESLSGTRAFLDSLTSTQRAQLRTANRPV